ncbi:hypothetical protein [Streptomyces doebereineriae]|uniref:DUF1778 domain-containing protein n=1 Tax=Streptomyces doebereineriae TaxID=3075528 RepID=A0ABU2VK50_9ACTN|nr:hypothetical protein [Streptomyces sp. DSM 41640]MDT0485277.1 hypothetical protein [Streptomyces sp. DSM 41640]
MSLTVAEQDQVHRAAEAAGKDVDDFMRGAVLAAANDPLAAREDRIQHDHAG